MASPLAATLGRHRTLVVAVVVVLVGAVYLRRRASIGTAADPNALNQVPTAGEGTLPEGSSGGGLDIEALTAALEGIQSGLSDLTFMNADTIAAAQSANEAAAQAAEAYNRATSLGAPAPAPAAVLSSAAATSTSPAAPAFTRSVVDQALAAVGVNRPEGLDPAVRTALYSRLVSSSTFSVEPTKRQASSPTPVATTAPASYVAAAAPVAAPQAIQAVEPRPIVPTGKAIPV